MEGLEDELNQLMDELVSFSPTPDPKPSTPTPNPKPTASTTQKSPSSPPKTETSFDEDFEAFMRDDLISGLQIDVNTPVKITPKPGVANQSNLQFQGPEKEEPIKTPFRQSEKEPFKNPVTQIETQTFKIPVKQPEKEPTKEVVKKKEDNVKNNLKFQMPEKEEATKTPFRQSEKIEDLRSSTTTPEDEVKKIALCFK